MCLRLIPPVPLDGWSGEFGPPGNMELNGWKVIREREREIERGKSQQYQSIHAAKMVRYDREGVIDMLMELGEPIAKQVCVCVKLHFSSLNELMQTKEAMYDAR